VTTRNTRNRPPQDDDWDTISGLPDDFDGWVAKTSFGYRDDYMDGEIALLIWEVESDDLDEPQDIIWSCGKGWEVTGRGKSVEHNRGRAKFTDTSMLGKLLNRTVQSLGVDMRGRGSAREAAVWEGMGFHFVREEEDYGGEIGVRTHLMPTEFLGFDKDEAEEEKPSPRRASRSRSAAPAQEPDPEPEEAPEEEAPAAPAPRRRASKTPVSLEEQLTKMAGLHDDVEEFQKAALKVEALSESENSDLMAAVLDDSDDGFFALAKAE
jgi:pyruvate/2-oxoglutarate dehydrogenase complex dihydrolipoamide acyltransferase (E2) component